MTLSLFVGAACGSSYGSAHAIVCALLLAMVAWFCSAFVAARRRRADFVSGQAERVHRAAEEEVNLGEVPSDYRVLAMVGVGDFAGARRALLADGGPSGQDAYEIRMCARIFIESFEGQPRHALRLCRELLQSATLSDARSTVRREGAVAVARIAAGVADSEDWLDLSRAPTFDPVLLWACRYALVLGAGADELATTRLFARAPAWPKDSSFFWLHQRWSARMGTAGRDLSVA